MWIAFAQTTAPAVQLEAGIAQEEVDDNLKAAMEIYKKIADDTSACRDIRSKALVRVGSSEPVVAERRCRNGLLVRYAAKCVCLS
jgi:hypothetical protein